MSTTTDWVTAASAVMQAVLAGGASYGLYRYTVETISIRQVAVKQASAPLRPFFSFHFGYDQAGDMSLIIATNVGEGHAMNVALRTGNGVLLDDGIRDICVVKGARIVVDRVPDTIRLIRFREGGGYRLEYSDVSGKRYWSTYEIAAYGDGVLDDQQYSLRSGEIERT